MNYKQALRAAQESEAIIYSVIIVPILEQKGFPIADETLRSEVKTKLSPRCLLTTRLHVASARFVKVGVSLTVHIFSDQKDEAVKAEVVAVLRKYFSPLDGGPNGAGWPFGHAVYVSDLYALLDQVGGVDFVERSEPHPEIFEDTLGAISGTRRLPADSTQPLAGLRLEPDELIGFLESESVITVVRQRTEVPG